jgi:capsular polysaccharide transport system ATP-binding protein
MLRFHSVTKSYPAAGGRKIVLHPFSGAIPRGQRIAILGTNGSGKSTLMRIMSGRLRPDSGYVERLGRVSYPVGFSGTFNSNLTGRENARFLAELYGMNTRETLDWIEDFAELGRYFDMPTRTYSTGMSARLNFATSFALEFDYYLVDEGMETGDSRFREKCGAAFKARLERATLVLVSHSLYTVRAYCTSGAVLHKGILRFFPKLEDAIDTYQTCLLERAA